MSTNWYAHATTDAYSPWLLLLYVIWCLFSDACMPKPMLPRLSPQTTDEVIQRMCIRYGWCMKSLDDVAWRWTKSFARWTHVMFMHVGLGWCNVSLAHVTCEIHTFHLWFSKPWLKPHSIGRRPFPDVHIHVGLGWHYLSYVDINRSICVVTSRNILS